VIKDDLVALFSSNAIRAGAGTRRVGDADKLRQTVSELIGGAGSVYCPGVTETESALVICPETRAGDYFDAEVTVEEVEAAIAETGTIVCLSSSGKALQAGLLPWHYVAIVSTERIFTDLDAFFARMRGPVSTNITFITGPSRTGDVELTLSVGVHGPGRLDVIIC
jgi:L-lactate utilization protein LutC